MEVLILGALLVCAIAYTYLLNRQRIDDICAERTRSMDEARKNLGLIAGMKKLIDAHHEEVKLLKSELTRVKDFIEIPESDLPEPETKKEAEKKQPPKKKSKKSAV